MTKLRYILICACLFVFGTLPAAAAQGGSGETVDVKGIVFGHIGDSYEWHITSWNGRELSVPLPVILRSETGRWDVFMSSRLAHGAEYGGYRRDLTRARSSNGSTEKMSDRSICRSRKRLSR